MTLECPCCGDDACTGDEFTDGQKLDCGCAGWVSVDEDDVYVVIGDDPCPPHALCHESGDGR